MLKGFLNGLFNKDKGPITYYKPPGDVKDGNVGAALDGAKDGKHAGLDLSGAKLTERGLTKLKETAWLRGLKLCNGEINDAGITALAGAPLEVLDLSGAPIVGACFQKLNGKLPNLKELHLPRTKLVDQAVPGICQFKTLEVLDVSGTKLTEMIVMDLIEMPRLKKLKMRDIPLDASVLASLTDKPTVEIDWDLNI